MKLSTAKGVRDFGTEQKILRNQIVDTLRQTFECYGFNPIETPTIERYDVLASKYAGGEEILKETFKLKDQGGRELCLRYDLTVPTARFVGMNPVLKMPFKRYQIGRVFRDGPIKLGRYREFWQCDVDIFGCSGMMADAEILTLAVDAFSRMELDVEIVVNSRKVLNGILDNAKIQKSKQETVILSLDKLAKYGENAVRVELDEKGISSEQVGILLDLIQKDLGELKELLVSEQGREGTLEIEEMFSYLNSDKIRFDPSLARGLSYYTGTVYEAFLRTSETKSAIAGGGRYDTMVGNFLGGSKQIPAVGISFGLELITDVKKDLGKKTNVEVYIIPIGTQKECMGIVKELRSAGIKSDIDIMGRGISKNLNYANALDIPFVLLIGEDELSKNKLKLKNMDSGEEQELSIKEIKNLFLVSS